MDSFSSISYLFRSKDTFWQQYDDFKKDVIELWLNQVPKAEPIAILFAKKLVRNLKTRNQSREPRKPRSRSNRRNQASSFSTNLPPWRGRLRSSSSSSQNHPHYCLCPRCQPLRSRAPHQADNNYRPTYRFRTYRLKTPPQFLPRHLAIGRRDPCFPNDIPTEQFCINNPNCTHNRQHMIDHYGMRYNDREPPFHSRYNLRPRNLKKKKKSRLYL
jgi:hypothetical protein